MDMMKILKTLLVFLTWILFWWALLLRKQQDDPQWLSTILQKAWSSASLQPSDDKYSRFEEVYTVLRNEYVDTAKLDSGAMRESAVKAFVDSIDDPYTVYMDNEQNSGFNETLKGETDFEGIGAVVSKKDYYVLIEEVIKDSPAFKAWLKALDRIVMVDTWSVKEESLSEAVARIRGPKDSTVKLTIERVDKKWERSLLEKEVVREKLNVPSVTSKIITGANGVLIWYLEISIIGEETDNLLKKEIATLKESKIQWLIVDLRGNGWWLLPIAVEISSHFIPRDKVIVSDKYTAFPSEEYTSKWYGELEWYPVVVLIDSMTASAGEIISLALQEQIWAKVVWTLSFGKWSIQTMKEFTDGSSMKYTIGKRFPPSGKSIDKIGITPDITVEFDMTGYTQSGFDNQLDEAKIALMNLLKK